MRLRAKSNYRSGWGEWRAGKEDTVSDEDGAFLLRDSPGTFEVVREGQGEGRQGEEGQEEQADERLTAMSTETMTGLTVPDRRYRGGRRRKS